MNELSSKLLLDIGIATIAYGGETKNPENAWQTKFLSLKFASKSKPKSHLLSNNYETTSTGTLSQDKNSFYCESSQNQGNYAQENYDDDDEEDEKENQNIEDQSPISSSFAFQDSPLLSASRRTGSSLTESEGLKESEMLLPLMKDWDFGASNGIWTHLSDNQRFQRFSVHPLVSVMLTVFDSLEFFAIGEHAVSLLNKTTTTNYFVAIENAYNPRDQVSYHNAIHAVDVVQTVFAMVNQDAENLRKINSLTLLALFFSAAIHDVGHPGVNNAHLIITGDDLALQYNDRSVLENFHISRAFSILFSSPSMDLLKNLRSLDVINKSNLCKDFRNLAIEMVLATDLSHHFQTQARFRARLAARGKENSLDFQDLADISIMCSILLHAADISNVAKSWTVYEPWIDLLFTEFFAQGDREKKLGYPVASFMDRDVSIPEKAQSAFITNIVLPLYTVLGDLTPNTSQKAIEHMNSNLKWLDRRCREKEASRRTSSAASLETITSQNVSPSEADEKGNAPDDEMTSGDEN